MQLIERGGVYSVGGVGEGGGEGAGTPMGLSQSHKT